MAKQTVGKHKALLKLIDKYYADLDELTRQQVLFEMGTRFAFHRLMADAALRAQVAANNLDSITGKIAIFRKKWEPNAEGEALRLLDAVK